MHFLLYTVNILLLEKQYQRKASFFKAISPVSNTKSWKIIYYFLLSFVNWHSMYWMLLWDLLFTRMRAEAARAAPFRHSGAAVLPSLSLSGDVCSFRQECFNSTLRAGERPWIMSTGCSSSFGSQHPHAAHTLPLVPGDLMPSFVLHRHQLLNAHTLKANSHVVSWSVAIDTNAISWTPRSGCPPDECILPCTGLCCIT